MTQEMWRPVPGMEETHEVSDSGRIRSWLKSGSARLRASVPREIKGSVFSTGYRMFWTPAGSRGFHRIVCEAFHGPCPSGMHVARHLDGDKLNNRADNLAWGTYAENMADARRHGTDPLGSRNAAAKLTESQVAQIKSLLTDTRGNRASLARRFGVSPSMVERIARGQNWTHVDPILVREGVES